MRQCTAAVVPVKGLQATYIDSSRIVRLRSTTQTTTGPPSSLTFGRITSADIPRQIQLSVRYQF